MPRIPITGGFTPLPEGTYTFCIYDVTYDEDFGRISVYLVTAKGQTHIEKYGIKNPDNSYNDGALNAFSYLAKNAMNDFTLEDIEPTDLIGHFLKATVKHSSVQSKQDPNQTRTFANLGDKFTADGWDAEPSEKALRLCGIISEPTPTVTSSSILDLLD